MTIYYKFNSFSQSISQASQDVAMGQSLKAQELPLGSSKASEVFYDFKPLGQKLPSRPQSTKVANLPPGKYPVPNSPKYVKFMEMQTKFCANDGKLVWQKLPKDVPIFYGIAGLVVVATLYSTYGLYRLASPAKN